MKKCLALALCLVLVLALPGCHGTLAAAPEVTDPAAPVETVGYPLPDTLDTSRSFTISFWAKNDTNLTQVAIYKKAIADFQALYPNITVKLKLYTDYGRIYNDVITNISTDTTPNVCISYPDHIATYLTGKDTVVPLDSLLAHPKFGLGGSELRYDGPGQGEIIPQFLQEGVIQGALYALPFMRSTEACYINKTFVERLGYTIPETLTWDFIWEVSDAAAQKDEDGNYLVNGQKVMLPFLYKSTDNMMIQLLRQQGAGYSTEYGQVQIFNDTTRAILETVAEHTAKGAFSTFKISSYPANFLNAGQCIFAVDSTAGATWMGSNAPLLDISEDQLVQFETVVMPIPQYDPSHPQMISQGPSVCVFQKDDPQEVLASWLFTQYLLTNDVQIAYSQTEGYVPVTSKAQNSAEYQDYLSREGEDNDFYYDIKIQASKLLLDNTANTFVTPVFNGSASLRNAAGQLIEETTKGVLRGKSMDAAFYSKLYDDITSLYRLDQISAANTSPQEFGPLPGTAIFLLAALGVTWLGILAYLTGQYLKKRKKQAK